MSKTITIPGDLTRLEVEINGVHYTYTGGETVEVPDEVAALLQNNAANSPEALGTRPVGGPLAAENKRDGNKGSPVVSDERGNLYAAGGGTANVRVEGHVLVFEDEE